MGLDDLDDLDGEVRHCSDIGAHITCKQYDLENLKYLSKNNNFSVVHINIRSLTKHYDQLVSMLSASGCSFDVIACSETWLNDRSYCDSFNLNGYKLYYKNRFGRMGGGVCLYVKSRFQANVCDNLALDDEQTDSLFVDISINATSNLIVGIVYRPPDVNPITFISKFEETLFDINRKNCNCIILGDFNIDISRDGPIINDFMNTIHSSSFTPTINRYTRVTHSSKSIIDNIITNIQNSRLESGVVVTDISDHYPIVLSLNLASKPPPKRCKIKISVLNERTLQQLHDNLESKVWTSVYETRDPETAYDSLIHELTESIHNTIPVKTVLCRNYDHHPWLTKGILNSIKRKNKLYKRYRKNPNDENKSKYFKFRNKLTHIMRKSKQFTIPNI